MMAIRRIPLRGSSTTPTVRQRVNLDGIDYLFELQWNGREGRWYMHFFDADASPIALGIKLVANARLLRRTTDSRRPPGEFRMIDVSGQGIDPELDDLNTRCILLYQDAGGDA